MAFETQSDTAADAATVGKPAASRRDGLRLLIALSVVVAIFQGVEGLNADTSWLLTVGDRWLDGARLYRDILDANPPIWLLIVMPGVLLGRIGGIQAEPILVVAIVALALGSVEWTVRTLAAGDLMMRSDRRRGLWQTTHANIKPRCPAATPLDTPPPARSGLVSMISLERSNAVLERSPVHETETSTPVAPAGTIVYSLIVPIYNEEAVLPLLFERLDGLIARLEEPTEVILVDDGSRDGSAPLIVDHARQDPHYRFIALSRNFGHQIAITAGMEAARGQATIVMDADLQDPPEVVLELVAKWKQGYEIVYAQRVTRDGETAFKLWTARAFYWVLRRLATVEIPENVGDFRLVDRAALDTFLAMPERDRFVRGMFGWMGFKQTAVPFHRQARAAGETKYPFWKMVKLAANGVVGFSDFPLRLALWLGSLISGVAVLYGIYVTVLAFVRSDLAAGWASIIVVVSFLSGINLLMLGVIGIYVGRIHTEVKQRPLYVVGRRFGFDAAPHRVERPLLGASTGHEEAGAIAEADAT